MKMNKKHDSSMLRKSKVWKNKAAKISKKNGFYNNKLIDKEIQENAVSQLF